MDVSLHGKRILVTREEKQGKQFAAKIRQCGGNPVEVPLLQIACKDAGQHQIFFQKLADYRWIFFTSTNGVRFFFQLARKYNVGIKTLQSVSIAAVGHKTGEALKEHGVDTAFIPTVYNAEVMAKEFFEVYHDISPVLIVRGSKSLGILPTAFENHSIDYDAMEVYETAPRLDMKERLNEILNKQEIDFITFTSPSSVETFHALANVDIHVPLVCIGTTTEKKAKQLGFHSILVAEEFTIDGMIRRLGKYIAKKEFDTSDEKL
jgi:uroporphyrinogen-III synthase